jgi:hypothetical protein
MFNGSESKKNFKGLWIEKEKVWDFENEACPVIHLEMSRLEAPTSELDFDNACELMLKNIFTQNGIDTDPYRFIRSSNKLISELILALRKKYNKKVAPYSNQ